VSNPAGSPAANIAPQYGYADPNNPNFQYTLSYTNSYTVEPGTTEWTADGSYNSGLAKVDNKGVTDVRTPAIRSTSAPQAAASITSSESTVTGLYPYFWGKSVSLPSAADIATAIAAGTENKVLADSNDTISVIYDAFDEYIWMAHEASYTEKTAWYFNDYNQGFIGAGNFILSPATENVNSPDGYWNSVSFKIYISDSPTITYGSLEYRNT
jgi:hypothetical protein